MAAHKRNIKAESATAPAALFREVKAYGPAIAAMIGMKVAIKKNPGINDTVADADAQAIVERLELLYR